MKQPSIQAARTRRRQRGVYAILLAPMLLGLVLCYGVVLDLAQVYNRRTEMQGLADGAALAAARALDGTAAGIAAAQAQAAAVAAANRYRYAGASVVWSNDALRFSAAPGAAATWVDAATAQGAAANFWFARVDTASLSPEHGLVATGFVHALDGTRAALSASARAVAGRTAIRMTPLAICAMSAQASAVRVSGSLQEKVEYGFRRGVGYNLLTLNPNGAAAVNFLVNPIDLPGGPLSAANLTAAVLNPFMCSGTMAMTRQPAKVYVSSATPFGHANQLNSRFGVYTGASPCTLAAAPPDRNVRQFTPAAAGWWGTTPAGQTATASTAAPLRTKADLDAAAIAAVSEPVTAAHYGPLWAYGPAAPAAGQAAFTTANWAALYPVNGGANVAASGYPAAAPPHARVATPFYTAPNGGDASKPSLFGRRLLNVALLECPVPASAEATVLAVGRFLMTAQASASAISGEFGGLVSEAELGGPVGLFQ